MIAEGHEIRQYLEDSARDFGIMPHIRFSSEVLAANFDTTTDLWTVDVRAGGEPATYRARFLYSCTGYYRYDAGYLPEFPGVDDYTGTLVHPQFWPADLDYTGKKVVVIGSGATAITLIPSMAPNAGHVTMLQRSPTYLFPYARRDPITATLQKVLPRQLSHDIIRYRNMLITLGIFLFCRGFPSASRRLMRWIAQRNLPAGYPVDTHFKPTYRPWDQRLCFIPDADFYKAVADGSAEVVTDTIDTFTPTGITLTSGRELDADIVVTATGLELIAFGGIDLSVDGDTVEPGERYAYRGYMLNDVPNFAWSVGYTNASWTLRVDLTSKAVADLLAYMREHGYTRAYPTLDGATPPAHGLLELDSGYLRRSGSRLPKSADTAPWQVRHNAITDAIDARRYDVAEAMVFA